MGGPSVRVLAVKKPFRTLLPMAGLTACLFSTTLGSLTQPPSTSASEDLYAKYLSVMEELNQSEFHQPLIIRSKESANLLQGDIYASVKFPFKLVSTHLDHPGNWCDLLILHINTKRCMAMTVDGKIRLLVHMGSKNPEQLTSTMPIDFTYSSSLSTPGYLAIVLTAAKGPLGTRNYRLVFESIGLSGTSSFVHVSYAYQYGVFGQIAMQSYLSTVGRKKLGFTRTGAYVGSTPEYIGGVRGALERNTMRYYLAVLAYMNGTHFPAEQQANQRLEYWIDAVEEYPQQLHETSREDYLSMKRAELIRQAIGDK
jgi:hypothetical protein